MLQKIYIVIHENYDGYYIDQTTTSNTQHIIYLESKYTFTDYLIEQCIDGDCIYLNTSDDVIEFLENLFIYMNVNLHDIYIDSYFTLDNLSYDLTKKLYNNFNKNMDIHKFDNVKMYIGNIVSNIWNFFN